MPGTDIAFGVKEVLNVEPTAPAVRRVNILVVEDDAGIAELLRSVFDDILGWETMIVGDAETALSLLSHASMDVLLVDVNLPGMKGTDLLATVHLRQGGRQPTAILMSTDAHVSHVQAALISGAARDFVAKPFDLDLLIDVLTRAVSETDSAPDDTEESTAVSAGLPCAA